MVDLSNVDNTTDLLKPISDATTTALNLKAPLVSPTFTGTVSGITVTMVGLGNVDNTTDLNKPVSTATTTALNLKSNLASPTFTGTLTTAGLTATGSTSLQTTTINGLTVTAPTSLQGTTINGLTVTAPTSLQGTAINGTCNITGSLSAYSATISSIDMYGNYTGMKPINGNYLQFYTLGGFTFNTNTATGFTGSNEALRIDNSAITLNKPTTINGTLSVNSVSISTTAGLTTPILNFSDNNQSALYSGAMFQQNQNMTIRSWNSGTSEATNIYFTTMNTAHEQSSTMVLGNNYIQLNQPTTIAGATTISGMLGLGGVSGRRFQISESTGGITMYIEDSGNIYTAGTFASGNASVGTLECWGDITSRGGFICILEKL